MGEAKDICVLVEHREGRPLDVSFEMLEDARKLADTLRQRVVALVLGGPAVPDFSSALAEHGADLVRAGRHPLLDPYESEIFVRVLAHFCEEAGPEALLLPATPNGQDLAGRLAARLGVGLVSFCLRFDIGPEREILGIKEAYGGKFYSTVACSSRRPHVFTFKPGAVGVGAPDKRRKAEVSEIALPALDETWRKTTVRGFVPADPRTIDLTEADMIVAGGAGVGTAEMFAIMQDLADALGASVGGTRPAVDRGWIPFERQIGQTGKIVAPRLYLAVGISGASLHAMGIKGSETIVAVNSDKNAPILKLAHLPVIGDLREIVPLLVTKIRQRRQSDVMAANSQ